MKRSTIRKAYAASSIPECTLHDALKRGILKRQSRKMKPILSEKHKKDRLKWCLSFINSRSLMFSCMHNIVHIDQKWFYMTKAVKKEYTSDNENMENRSGRSKRFIPKIMFLSEVVRPLFDVNGDCIFDRKLGIWASTKLSLRKGLRRIAQKVHWNITLLTSLRECTRSVCWKNSSQLSCKNGRLEALGQCYYDMIMHLHMYLMTTLM